MERLLNIVNNVLDNNNKPKINTLDFSLKLRDDLDLDSLALAELTVKIESDFGIDIFEDGLVFTLGEVAKKIGIYNE